MAPVRVPVILPKAVTTTDTDELSVKSADYSVNNDLPRLKDRWCCDPTISSSSHLVPRCRHLVRSASVTGIRFVLSARAHTIPRVHHAHRRRSRRVAACGARAVSERMRRIGVLMGLPENDPETQIDQG